MTTPTSTSNLVYAATTNLADLVAIIDAEYEGDLNGTNANKQYFLDNIHKYLKDAAIALLPQKHYMVGENYSSLNKPYFSKVSDAYAGVITDGSSSTDKALIEIRAKTTSYGEALTLNHDGYVVFRGIQKDTSIISGNIILSTGVHIFENVKFSNNISITGGVAVFINCSKVSGNFLQSGGSTVLIHNCEHWSAISVSGNNNKLFITNVDNILGTDGASLTLAAGMTGGTYVMKNSDCEGTINEGTAFSLKKNVEEGVEPKPTY
jgi:hypothetical protein